MRVLIVVLVAGFASAPYAQPAPQPAAARPAAASRPPASAPQAPAGGPPEARVQRTVIEDDRVRVDELRVRGQTRSILVQPKLPGAPAYQIGTSTDGRDTAQDRRSEGRSLWQILAF